MLWNLNVTTSYTNTLLRWLTMFLNFSLDRVLKFLMEHLHELTLKGLQHILVYFDPVDSE
jgi:hypothetical protein